MRALRFNAVGAMGFALQLIVLSLLVSAGVHYLAATALAVEAAILHNFVWHERWTWADRGRTGRGVCIRLLRFHAVNGVVSLAGNLLLMPFLVRLCDAPVLLANAIAVVVCAMANFAGADRVVFRRGGTLRWRSVLPNAAPARRT